MARPTLLTGGAGIAGSPARRCGRGLVRVAAAASDGQGDEQRSGRHPGTQRNTGGVHGGGAFMVVS
jgi:hypothetical protein